MEGRRKGKETFQRRLGLCPVPLMEESGERRKKRWTNGQTDRTQG
jgi:hypothetical protein